ncbi:MAG: exopolyphosphatase [Planctomycetes bacterium]|nr:exopolyphosphatase [Planctomycetota bacterium]
MRIVTRGDFDGLASSVLVTEVEQVRELRFVHPKDAQDGKVEADDEDIVINIPYIKGCGMWFDHHISEEASLPDAGSFKGRFEVAPSCARVIYNHYVGEHADKFDKHHDMLLAADRLDSAQLDIDDITNPTGWILLGLTLDPRSGLGPEFRKYFRWLVEYIKELPIEKVLLHPEVKKRTDRVLLEQEEFKAILEKHTSQDGNVIITDFRGMTEKPVGNRFLVYTMFPEANVELRLFDGHKGAVVAAVGHSIFNRTCNINVGDMLKEYGGGGHRGAGTTQLPAEIAEEKIAEILGRLKKNEG